MQSAVGKLGKFIRDNYRGIGLSAPSFSGVHAGGDMSEYGCISSKCVCNCGGGWCSPKSGAGNKEGERINQSMN